MVAEPGQVGHGDGVAASGQAWSQHGADVSSAAGDEDPHFDYSPVRKCCASGRFRPASLSVWASTSFRERIGSSIGHSMPISGSFQQIPNSGVAVVDTRGQVFDIRFIREYAKSPCEGGWCP